MLNDLPPPPRLHTQSHNHAGCVHNHHAPSSCWLRTQLHHRHGPQVRLPHRVYLLEAFTKEDLSQWLVAVRADTFMDPRCNVPGMWLDLELSCRG